MTSLSLSKSQSDALLSPVDLTSETTDIPTPNHDSNSIQHHHSNSSHHPSSSPIAASHKKRKRPSTPPITAEDAEYRPPQQLHQDVVNQDAQNQQESEHYDSFKYQARRSTRIRKKRRRALYSNHAEWDSEEELQDWATSQNDLTESGYTNIGDSCWMGAVLSALTHLPTFIHDMCSDELWNLVSDKLSTDSSVFRALRQIFTSTKTEVNPKSLKDVLSDHHQAFEGLNQEDAHEFLLCALQHIHTELSQVIQPSHTQLNPVENCFSGSLVYMYTCDACTHQTTVVNSFRELSLAVPRDKCLGDRKLKRNELLTISDLFNFHFSPHNIERRCSVCGHNSSTCQILLEQLPRVLCLQFKRFYHQVSSGTVTIKKTGNQIKLNDSLNVKGACAPHFLLPQGVDQLKPYKLVSFINHRGTTPARGHYTTCAKKVNSPDWVVINDELTSRVEKDQVEAEIFRREHRRDVYLAFFEINSQEEASEE